MCNFWHSLYVLWNLKNYGNRLLNKKHQSIRESIISICSVGKPELIIQNWFLRYNALFLSSFSACVFAVCLQDGSMALAIIHRKSWRIEYEQWMVEIKQRTARNWCTCSKACWRVWSRIKISYCCKCALHQVRNFQLSYFFFAFFSSELFFLDILSATLFSFNFTRLFVLTLVNMFLEMPTSP